MFSSLLTHLKIPGIQTNFYFSRALPTHPWVDCISVPSPGPCRSLSGMTKGEVISFRNISPDIEAKTKIVLASELRVCGRIWNSLGMLPEIEPHSWLSSSSGPRLPFSPLPQQAHPSRGSQMYTGRWVEMAWDLPLDLEHAVFKDCGDILGVVLIAGDPRAWKAVSLHLSTFSGTSHSF